MPKVLVYFLLFISGGSKLEIKTYEDIEKFREACGASSVMIARAAQWNPSIFRAEGPIPMHDIINKYLRYVRKCSLFPLYCL